MCGRILKTHQRFPMSLVKNYQLAFSAVICFDRDILSNIRMTHEIIIDMCLEFAISFKISLLDAT